MELPNNTKKIFYIGYNYETFNILSKSFNVSTCAHIDLFEQKTFNPVNLLFKLVYKLRTINSLRLIEVIFYYIFSFFSFLSSGPFRKYRSFLNLIFRKKVTIIDTKNHIKTKNYIVDNRIDLVIVHVWEMLPDDIVFSAKMGTINIHPSMLPKYRGALPELWVLKNGDKESAVTYMTLNKSMDSGGILEQHIFQVSNDNWQTMLEKERNIINDTLVNCVNKYLDNLLKPKLQNEQDASSTEKYEVYRKIDLEKENLVDIYNKINIYPADVPGTYCYFICNKRKIYIKKAMLKHSGIESSVSVFKFTFLTMFIIKNSKTLNVRLFVDVDIISSIVLLFNKC